MSSHPGKILNNFLNRYNIKIEELADNIEVNPIYLASIIEGENWIDATLAYKLGIVFDTGMKFWLDLQTNHDIKITAENMKNWTPKSVYLDGLLRPF